jgi:serine/threonine protein kinase
MVQSLVEVMLGCLEPVRERIAFALHKPRTSHDMVRSRFSADDIKPLGRKSNVFSVKLNRLSYVVKYIPEAGRAEAEYSRRYSRFVRGKMENGVGMGVDRIEFLFDGTQRHIELVMEAADYTLHTALGRGFIPTNMAALGRVLYQVARHLKTMEDDGVAHGDLSSANVYVCEMLDGRQAVHLGDFGLTTTADDAQALMKGPAMWRGTPGYMAPELFGQGQYHPSPDVYAFGVLCHKVLTRRIPRHPGKKHTLAYIQQVRSGQYREALLEGLPIKAGNIKDIIAEAVHSDPAQRTQSFTPIVQELQQYVS